MAPSRSLALDRLQGTPVVVKLQSPNWSISEVPDDEDDDLGANPTAVRKGSRGKNARQLTWVLLLKAHRAAGCLASLATAPRRLLSPRRAKAAAEERRATTTRRKRGWMYKSICVVLVLALMLLALEAMAWYKGMEWVLSAAELRRLVHAPLEINGLFEIVYSNWVFFRKVYVAPALQTLANVCVVLFLVQSADRVVLCLECFWIKLKRIKPEPLVEEEDVEAGGKGYFPMVLVQIPMCNEREVYQQSIAACCCLDWPRTNMLVQVLDDSDDPEVQELIKEEVAKWQRSGARVVYRHRLKREGYKAGNLKSAMACNYVKDYEFVVIFDADFQPNPDFLRRTIPHFKGREDVALVQARWSFVNQDENLLTRLQKVNLCFHFEVEQQASGHFLGFFGFNGTAGVWRIKALEDSGGWMERTTVEDMDIAVRAHLRGWRFIYLNDVKAKCELPECFEAYRKQQHRWHSGPMQLFRLCLPEVLKSKIGLSKKFNLVFLFFLLRKLVLPFYSFTLFCIILPLTMFVPEAELPTWVVCYVPTFMSFLNVLPSPSSFPFAIPYLLFENTMSVTKFRAMVSGLFQLGSAYEWVVTKKSGRGDEAAVSEKESHGKVEKVAKQKRKKVKNAKWRNRVYKKELALAFLLLAAAARSFMFAKGLHFFFLLFQGASFLLVGLDLIGQHIA